MGKMPVLFVGHGSPMNAIEDNEFTRGWEKIAARIPKPEAILAVSAHWYTNGTRLTDAEHPRMVYDMYGFPEELYKFTYNAPGAPELARLIISLTQKNIIVDNSWGIDHGTWSVLCKMIPEADIPLIQLSVDREADAESHYRLGQEIASLREKGVLILASGNVVHNLARVNWNMDGGYPWAEEFDLYIKEKVMKRQFQDVIHFESAGTSSRMAFVSPDHFYPLLYILGASNDNDRISVLNDSCIFGSLSMTSYLFE